MAKKPFGGMKIIPDATFAAVIGKGAVSPAEMTKKIWVYIKKKKLLKR
jgi:chromatin remodeling complex protein RSC6